MGVNATVVLSLDAELRWGVHDCDEIPETRVSHARESWEYLLDLFEEYGIPATWAVVGHLFLQRCDGIHSDHPAGREWFPRDGRERVPDSDWFGRGLITAVRDSEIDHEIGSHSFSHVEFGKQTVSREVAEAELECSVDAAKDCGVTLESFVFPRNSIGYRELLPAHGFSCYRGHSPARWYDGRPLRGVGKLATVTCGLAAPPIVEPEIDEHGTVNVPASMYLFTVDGAVRDAIGTVTSDPVLSQVALGLEQLKDRQEGVFHLWLHPNNITTNRDRHRMEQLSALIANYHDKYGIEIATMSEIADRVTANE